MSILKPQVEAIAQDKTDILASTLGTAATENATAFAPAAQGATLGASSTTTVGIVTVNTREITINGVTIVALVV